jgi:hypothetical protein
MTRTVIECSHSAVYVFKVTPVSTEGWAKKIVLSRDAGFRARRSRIHNFGSRLLGNELLNKLYPGLQRRALFLEEAMALINPDDAAPDPMADGISAFTREDLVRICEARFGKTFHPASLGRLIRRLGFSRQKARPSHPQKDPAEAEAFKKSSARVAKKWKRTTRAHHGTERIHIQLLPSCDFPGVCGARYLRQAGSRG